MNDGQIIAGFLAPHPPHLVYGENPPQNEPRSQGGWEPLRWAYEHARRSLEELKPDVLLAHSPHWITQQGHHFLGIRNLNGKSVLQGLHVDDNWHEYGDLPFDMKIDVEFAELALKKTAEAGIKAKSVDYDHFPVDTGAIIASNFLNPGGATPLAITSNNVYHDWQMTESLGRVAADSASELGRKLAVIGGNFNSATVHAYGPLYGSAAAVVEFNLV